MLEVHGLLQNIRRIAPDAAVDDDEACDLTVGAGIGCRGVSTVADSTAEYRRAWSTRFQGPGVTIRLGLIQERELRPSYPNVLIPPESFPPFPTEAVRKHRQIG
jgi:hypothetical protein